MRTKSLKMSPKAWFIALLVGMTAFASGCTTSGHSGGFGGFVNSSGSCFVNTGGTPWCR
jgi:ABC-type transporter Mla maintaining outer membrane lipid asymmetry permease subunit MlaE